jgi:signal peptidase II
VKRKTIIIVALIATILIADQAFKIWVKTHFYLYEQVNVLGDWFRLNFVENEGMAFGMVFFGGYWSKLILTLLRLAASSVIVWAIVQMIRKNVSWGLLICTALVFAGAVGNIIDCIFYGKIFSQSVPFGFGEIATLFPDAGGYAACMQGKVVDMLQFDLFTIHFPSWIPYWGGTEMNFFPAIFNIADSSITIGLFTALIFYWKKLSQFLSAYKFGKTQPQNTEQ